jgi:hypothetical protein
MKGSLAHGCEYRDGGELACAVVEPRTGPDVAERIARGCSGQKRKLLSHAFQRRLRSAIVQAPDDGIAALQSFFRHLRFGRLRDRAEQQRDGNCDARAVKTKIHCCLPSCWLSAG